MKVKIKTLEELGGKRPPGWNRDGRMDYLYGQTVEVRDKELDMKNPNYILYAVQDDNCSQIWFVDNNEIVEEIE